MDGTEISKFTRLMLREMKRRALEAGLVRRTWAASRAGQLHRRYRRWSLKYGALAHEQGLRYSEDSAIQMIRARLSHRCLKARIKGEVHTAIMVLTRNWGLGMVQEAELLGPVSVFDWEKIGFSEADPDLEKKIPEINARFISFVRETHHQRPIDWLLITCTGNLILKETLSLIREELGIPTVNQWLDCKQNFESGVTWFAQDTGQRDIASEFDLVWTSSRSVCEWYMACGARPLFLPEGFSPRLTPRLKLDRTNDIGFLGTRYGLRPDYIEALKRTGHRVTTRGAGWAKGSDLPLDQMGEFFAQSKVNLGMGGVGYSMELTTVKGRDFEIPGAGGVYLTSYNSDLAQFFKDKEEIVFYHGMEEMVELASELVINVPWRKRLALAAYQRSMREHRWLHRFETILSALGIYRRMERSNA